MILKWRGLNIRLIVQAPEHDIKRNVDVWVVKLLSGAHHYSNLLTAGKASSFKEIGILEKLSSSRVLRVPLLAFLSPDIIKGVLGADIHRHWPQTTSCEVYHCQQAGLNKDKCWVFTDQTQTLIFELSACNLGAFYFREYSNPKWDIRAALFQSEKNH